MTDPPAEIPDLPDDRSIDRLVSLLGPLSRVTRRGSTASSASPPTSASMANGAPKPNRRMRIGEKPMKPTSMISPRGNTVAL